MRNRFLLYALLLALGFGSLLVRCWQLQIQSEGLFEDQAMKNQLRTIPITAKRGEILDCNGICLAGNRDGYRVKLLDPSLPITHQQCKLLAALVGGSVSDLKKKPSPTGVSTSIRSC